MPCRWVRWLWLVLLQHPGRSAVSVQRFGTRVLVMHRSHFGSRYKLGCCGHAGLFYVRRLSLAVCFGRVLLVAWCSGRQRVEWSGACTHACLAVFCGVLRSYVVFCCGFFRAVACRQPFVQLVGSARLLAAARKQAASREILLWMTPSEAPKALQASECSELLDPMRASCWISAQH